jgi:hypothetical protein
LKLSLKTIKKIIKIEKVVEPPHKLYE